MLLMASLMTEGQTAANTNASELVAWETAQETEVTGGEERSRRLGNKGRWGGNGKMGKTEEEERMRVRMEGNVIG